MINPADLKILSLLDEIEHSDSKRSVELAIELGKTVNNIEQEEKRSNGLREDAKTKIKSLDPDEAYGGRFECPQCKDTMITLNSNFCPNCGLKLEWPKKRKET